MHTSESNKMKINPTKLNGVYTIDIEQNTDERGFFARLFSAKEFEAARLENKFVETSTSFNLKKGTLRGMHYQKAPYEEAKLIHCIYGSVYYVIADIRPDSETFKKWFGITLHSSERRQLFTPKGCAVGFMTLEDNTEILYQISQFYTPEAVSGFRYNDSVFAIEWPESPVVISEKDKNWTNYK